MMLIRISTGSIVDIPWLTCNVGLTTRVKRLLVRECYETSVTLEIYNAIKK